MILDLRLIFLPLLSFLPLLFGIFIYSRNRKSLINLFYGLAVLNIGLWSLGIFMFFIYDLSQMRFWSNFVYLTGSFIVTSFFMFAIVFPNERATIRFSLLALILSPNLLFFYLLFFTNTLIKDVLFDPAIGSRSFEFGPLYFLYWAHFILTLITAFLMLLKKYRVSAGIEEVRLCYILLASAVTAIFNTTTNLILPTFGNFNYFWLGPYSTFILVPVLAIAIVRYQLFDVRVVATEFLTFAIWIFLLARTLLAQSLQERIIDGGLLAFLIVLGILLIRSVRKEVKQREQLELLTKDLQIANARLKELDDLKTDFISIASHQLRTPLTAIKGYSSMILEGTYGETPVTVRGVVDKIFQSAQRLIFIVNDLLDVSRIEQGRMQLMFEEVKVFNALKDAADELKFTADRKNVAIEFKVSVDDAETKIKADYGKIRQVFINLIDNALKYTPEGFIKISLERKKDNVVVAVRDSGIGLSEDTIQKLFQKFSRARGVTKFRADGSGLGLYIVREIVKAHGGEVWVESQGEGKGSQFYVSLPLHNPSAEAVQQFVEGM